MELSRQVVILIQWILQIAFAFVCPVTVWQTWLLTYHVFPLLSVARSLPSTPGPPCYKLFLYYGLIIITTGAVENYCIILLSCMLVILFVFFILMGFQESWASSFFKNKSNILSFPCLYNLNDVSFDNHLLHQLKIQVQAWWIRTYGPPIEIS